jgi:hypothetical protein
MPPPDLESIDESNSEDRYHERMRLIFSYYAIASTCLFGALFTGLSTYLVIVGNHQDKFIAILVNQVGATIGVPLCSLIALFNVLLLRTVQGPIEMEAFGIKFKGASGPIVMWILCFLALVWAIGYLWK